MLKKHISFFLLLLLFISLCMPAQADGPYALQDPVKFSSGLAEHLYNYNKETHLQKQYKVSRQIMPLFIDAYVSMLKEDVSLVYLGVTQNNHHIYHCFAPAEGYDYATFCVATDVKQITPECCIAVQYEQDDTKAYIRYGLNFIIQDNGLRMIDYKN